MISFQIAEIVIKLYTFTIVLSIRHSYIGFTVKVISGSHVKVTGAKLIAVCTPCLFMIEFKTEKSLVDR